MIATYRRTANLALALYFVFKLASIGWLIAAERDTPFNTIVFWLIFLTGTVFGFRACWAQARGRGHSGIIAWVAIFGFWGFVIVTLLTDRAKDGGLAAAPSAPATRDAFT